MQAVDLAFADNCVYGQLVKDYRNSDMPGRYAPPEMVSADRRVILGDIDPFSICTSQVERNNLTIRTFMKRFTRLALGFSKKLENLVAAVAIYVAYYNFVWQHKTLGGRSPAMMAGITGHPWSMEELYEKVMATE